MVLCRRTRISGGRTRGGRAHNKLFSEQTLTYNTDDKSFVSGTRAVTVHPVFKTLVIIIIIIILIVQTRIILAVVNCIIIIKSKLKNK